MTDANLRDRCARLALSLCVLGCGGAPLLATAAPADPAAAPPEERARDNPPAPVPAFSAAATAGQAPLGQVPLGQASSAAPGPAVTTAPQAAAEYAGGLAHTTNGDAPGPLEAGAGASSPPLSSPVESGAAATGTVETNPVDANPPVASPLEADPGSAGSPAGTAQATAGTESLAETASAPADNDLWNRIRRGFKMPDLDTKRAQASTRWYAAKPDYIARMASRANLYLFHIVEELEKRGMPTELALLPFVESAMQPDAVSFAQAAGLWQFIPSTGRLYALEQNLWKDERFGVIESTRAALDYLQKLYAEFGDWQLALAAYNCGEAGVERALARARASHRSMAYKDLRLPNETQYYVPKLQAIKNIVADPQHYGIDLPAIRNEPYFVAVSKTPDMDVATAARLADVPLEDFRLLNPAFSRPVIMGAAAPAILVPADHADVFNANLAAWKATGQPLASWTAYTLQPGETLDKLAARLGLTEAQLREANHIPPRYRAAPGSTVLIPRDENSSDDIDAGFLSASFSLVPENGSLRQVSYRVRRGDTLDAVARRWHVSADDIVAWNQLHDRMLFAGQRLSLTVARPTTAAAPHRVAAKKGAGHGAARSTTAAAAASPPAARGGATAHTPAAAVITSSRM